MNCLSLILALSVSALASADADASVEGAARAPAHRAAIDRAEAAFAALDNGVGRASGAPQRRAAAMDEVRADTAEARLEARRTGLRSARLQLEAIAAERQALEARHGDLNRRIEALKAEHLARDPLWSSPALEALLRDSQELSERLARKAEEERQANQRVLEQRELLGSALDREIGRLHAAWDGCGSAEQCKALVPQLRALHAERRALHRPSPMPRGQGMLPKLSARDADDPGVLLEMADAFLDGEDKLRREERALARHIEQLENEQELERRLSALMEEESLFDESERRISLSRSAHLYPESKVPSAGAANSSALGTVDDGSALAAPAIDSALAGSASQALGAESGQAADVSSGASAAGAPSEALSADLTQSPGSERSGAGATQARANGSAGESSSAVAEKIAADGSALAGRSNLELLSSERAARPFQGDWSESNSLKALRAHQAYLKARADELHRQAEEAARRARDLL